VKLNNKVFLLCVMAAVAGSAVAANPDVHVPDDLKQWEAWVLEGREYRDCPFIFNSPAENRDDFVCAWPGGLNLRVDANGGRFSQRWTIFSSDEWLPLPGDLSNWPQQVSVDGQPATVVARNEGPSVRLPPGRYDITGLFEWSERPRTLRIPPQSGLLDLSIDGVRVLRPERNGRNVWLGEREREKKVEDALQVQVYRLVADDVPTRLTTFLMLEVSGSVREELIGPALPAGFIPLAIVSGLPTRLEPDGNLRIQVRPGSWQLRLLARAGGVLDEVTLPEPEMNLPATEIWSYESNDELRVTMPEGLTPVDPQQVGVPEYWQELPGFRVDVGDTLTITERSRGMIEGDNQLGLGRQLWLDFNGDGFVFADNITGRMRSGWRLDMDQPYALSSATGEGENLLVTHGAEEGFTGIEVRAPNVGLRAVGRTESRGVMPVTGWQARFNDVNTTLHLPPGNKLLAAIGADRSSTSWVNRWKLLDFFLVLIISISAARLFGREAGVLSLLALTLSLHEPGAPEFIWLNLLVAVALVRVAPEGRLAQISKSYRILSLVVLLVVFVPFAAQQLRVAIYPQLESQVYRQGIGVGGSLESALYGAGRPSADATSNYALSKNAPTGDRLQLEQAAGQEMAVEKIVVAAARSPVQSFNRYPTNAIVQVGPGRPAWQWNSYTLNWSGPVDPDRSMRLVVMPRWIVTLLRFIEVGLLGAFIAVFVFEVQNRAPPWLKSKSTRTGSAPSVAGIIAAVVFMSAALTTVSPAHADTPSETILKQLEQRLLEPPPCVPHCAEIIDANVVIAGGEMTILLTANALENVSLPLPGSLQGWRPEQVLIDNTPAQAYRGSDQTLWIRTPEGRHVVAMQGPLPPVDNLEVPFPTPPRVIRVETSDWFVAGIKDRRLLSGSLQLTRLQQSSDGDTTARWESSRFPIFVRVERTINLDLDWRVTTTVYRVAPVQGALSISVPLLSGESVTAEDFTVNDGQILVSMNPTQKSVSWQSTIPLQSPLILQAPEDAPWKEVWSIAIGSIWHASFAGIPESESGDMGLSYRVARFYPRAGESLQLDADRPAATSGDTLVFDSVRISSELGGRSRKSNLNLNYRSTRGAEHAIRLPNESEIITVVIDGSIAPLRAEGGELQLPILPGVHNINIAWRDDDPASFRESIPVVDLGAGASNIHASLTLPPNRWVVATFGPRLGPGVLYWTELIVLILIAAVLGRLTLTPLRTRQWLLLGLGFSTFSWSALTLIVVWLLASGALQDLKNGRPRWQYNGVQVLFTVLSLGALATIVVSLPTGLLGSPEMHVVGNGSYGNFLQWFDDRSESVLPVAYVLSVPIWIYKVLILAWSLWLSFALLRWLPWVWKQFVADSLWKPRVNPAKPAGETV